MFVPVARRIVTWMTQEADDAARRKSVESLFADALAKAGTSIGDEPPRFAHVFSTALERVGSAVQEEAKAANLEQPPEPQVALCEFMHALVPSQVTGLGRSRVGGSVAREFAGLNISHPVWSWFEVRKRALLLTCSLVSSTSRGSLATRRAKRASKSSNCGRLST